MTSESSSKPRASKIVELDYPFEWPTDDGKKLIESIELQRPKGKHIKKFGTTLGMEALMALASKLSGYTPGFFEEMDASDVLKINDVLADFLEGGQKTGKAT